MAWVLIAVEVGGMAWHGCWTAGCKGGMAWHGMGADCSGGVTRNVKKAERCRRVCVQVRMVTKYWWVMRDD